MKINRDDAVADLRGGCMRGAARRQRGGTRQRAALLIAGVCGAVLLAGCTAESTRLALQNQRRADDVQQALFERQRDGLRALLYRDLTRRLEVGATPLSGEQRAVLNEAWNERDLLEFWSIQQERARALRLVGVDAKLFADQSIVDLLIKSVEAKADRAKEGIASMAGAAMTSAPSTPAAQDANAGEVTK